MHLGFTVRVEQGMLDDILREAGYRFKNGR